MLENCGNFQALHYLLAEYDDDLRSHLENGKKNTLYISKLFKARLLLLLVILYVKRCSAIREDGAIFPTIADEVTERYSNKKILSLRLTSNFQVFKFALGKLHHLPFTPITEAMFF